MKASSLSSYVHPIFCGVFGFAATAIGAHFFKHNNPWVEILLGIALFLLANQFMLKFQFNSYNLNGATATTALVFLTQVTCIMLWKQS